MPEDLNITAARDTAAAITSQRTAHAIINRAITRDPATPCRCSLCVKGETIRLATSRGEKQPFRWTVAALGKDDKQFPASYFCHILPGDGIHIKITGKDPHKLVEKANAIEALASEVSNA